MQTLYVVHVSPVGMVSVDTFSPKHTGVSGWRRYYPLGTSTRARLRALRRKYPANVKIMKGWSPMREKDFKAWGKGKHADLPGQLSLDYLATSVPRHNDHESV